MFTRTTRSRADGSRPAGRRVSRFARTLAAASVLALSALTGAAIAPLATVSSAYAADTLTGGQRLNADQSILSGNGQYQFVMQRDGNLVLYFSGRPLWASNTAGNSGAFAVMQGDGNLVVYSASGRALWASGTWGNAGARVAAQSDGNVVIYSSSGQIGRAHV